MSEIAVSPRMKKIRLKYNNPHLLLLGYVYGEDAVEFKLWKNKKGNKVMTVSGFDGREYTINIVAVYNTTFLLGHNRGDIVYQRCDECYQYKDNPKNLINNFFD